VLDTVAAEVEKEYGMLNPKWGDVMRFRRGNADVPGNGAPSQLGAIRTIGVSPFKDGTVEAVQGDTFYAVIEYGTPQRAEVLLNYGNWSKKGSKHIDDQLPLASKKQMRPMWRDRKDIEANLESRKVL
jgi:acyl-homoserine-lactone acylase